MSAFLDIVKKALTSFAPPILRKSAAGGSVSDLLHPTAWLKSWALGGRTLAGVDINPATAMTISAYFAAVRAISEDIAKLPLITYQEIEPRGKRRAKEHPVYPILKDAPNDLMSSMSFRETMNWHALTWGNGYAEIVRTGRRVQGIMKPIHPSRVTPKFDENGDLVYDVRIGDIGSTQSEAPRQFDMVRFPQDMIFHLKGFGDGIQGLSVAHLARQSLGLALAAEEFGAAFFGNGTHMAGVLKHPQTLSETAMQHLRDSWTERYSGPDNAHKPAILEEGMTWERMGIPPNDAQFLETREFQVTEISRWFRIPLHKISSMKQATFSNIEQQALEYVVDTLMPWFVRWEQEIKRKLFVSTDPFFAEHLVAGLLRGDQKSRSMYYRTLFMIGALSPNDIRELENGNPITDEDGEPDPAGELYYVQGTMQTLGAVAGTRTPVGTITRNGQTMALVPIASNGHSDPNSGIVKEAVNILTENEGTLHE